MSLRAAVFASGRGSNFQILADHGAGSPERPWRVTLLVTDREGAPVLDRARERGVPGEVVPPAEDAGSGASSPPAGSLIRLLEGAGAEIVLLAGYLRLIPPPVVRRFGGRMLNLHPALLPAFGGKGMYGERVHRAVLEAGCRVSGVTVHFVDEAYDRGRIFAQWPVPVREDDTPATLARRIHEVEHRLYPAAVDALARALVRGETPAFPGGGALHFHPGGGPPPIHASPDPDPSTDDPGGSPS